MATGCEVDFIKSWANHHHSQGHWVGHLIEKLSNLIKLVFGYISVSVFRVLSKRCMLTRFLYYDFYNAATS